MPSLLIVQNTTLIRNPRGGLRAVDVEAPPEMRPSRFITTPVSVAAPLLPQFRVWGMVG